MKNIFRFSLLFLFSTSLFICSGKEKNMPAENLQIYPEFISREAGTYIIKVPADRKNAVPIKTPAGFFRKNQNYLITIHYRVLNPLTDDTFSRYVNGPKDPFLYFSVFTPEEPGVLICGARGYSREWDTQILRFFTGASGDTVVLNIEGRPGVNAEIKEITIQEGIAPNQLSLLTPSAPFAEPELPTGAAEFEVELPRPHSGPVVQAADFGVSAANPDNAEALEKALKFCMEKKASKLVLPAGEKLYIRRTGTLAIVEGLSDFEMDGNNATLLLAMKFETGASTFRFFDLRHCERIKLKNLTIDWDWENDPLGAMVECLEQKGEEVVFRFVDYEDFPKKDWRIAYANSMETNRLLGTEEGLLHHFEFYSGKHRPKVTWLNGNTIRLQDNGNSYTKARMFRFKPGKFYRLSQYHGELVCFHNEGCRNLTYENIRIYSVPGFGFQNRNFNSNWQLLHCVIAPPEGDPQRVITTTVDDYGQERTLGNMKMIGCRFNFGHDDAINMLNSNYPVVRADAKTVVTRNLVAGIKTLHVGDRMEVRTATLAPTGFFTKIVSIKPLKPEDQPDMPWLKKTRLSYALELADPIPEAFGTDMVLFNDEYKSGNAILRDCVFENLWGTGTVVQTTNVTIENCHYKLLPRRAMKFATGYTYNICNEGTGVDNVVVRNCTFEETARDGNDASNFVDSMETVLTMYTYWRTHPSFHDRPPYPMIRNVLFENNTFIETYGLIASMWSVENVIFKGNTIINRKERLRPVSYRGGFFAANSSNLYFLDNVWLRSPLLKEPTLWYEDNIKSVFVRGNRIVDTLPELKK